MCDGRKEDSRVTRETSHTSCLGLASKLYSFLKELLCAPFLSPTPTLLIPVNYDLLLLAEPNLTCSYSPPPGRGEKGSPMPSLAFF